MSGQIVCGGNMPEDLKAMLRRWGVNLDETLSFKLECESAGAPLLLTSTTYVVEPLEETKKRGEFKTETRTFKLVEVQADPGFPV